MHKYLLILLLIVASCSRHHPQEAEIVSLRIIDQNGFSESINSKDRLSEYKNVDFTRPQPYQKVLCVYGKNPDGTSPSYVMSYYPNGQIRQFIAAINNRAHGQYREWYPNGTLKVDATVIGGVADLSPSAEKSWVFDGINKAYDDNGHLIAEIPYCKGDLEGTSKYFYENGTLWKSLPFHKNKMEGEVSIYFKDGTLQEQFFAVQGEKNGLARSFWNKNIKKSEENYENGFLKEGLYTKESGELLASVKNGYGERVYFYEDNSYQIEEIKKGIHDGSIKVYSTCGKIKQQYHLKEGMKYGEELFYEIDPETGLSKKKLSISWADNRIQGCVKTWYSNGNLESQREICDNKKNGYGRAWYKDGSILLIEEYNQDILVSGEYFKKGEAYPTSRVINGKGVATLFNEEGQFLRKIVYHEGKPIT